MSNLPVFSYKSAEDYFHKASNTSTFPSRLKIDLYSDATGAGIVCYVKKERQYVHIEDASVAVLATTE